MSKIRKFVGDYKSSLEGNVPDSVEIPTEIPRVIITPRFEPIERIESLVRDTQLARNDKFRIFRVPFYNLVDSLFEPDVYPLFEKQAEALKNSRSAFDRDYIGHLDENLTDIHYNTIYDTLEEIKRISPNIKDRLKKRTEIS